jgi:hypothetical protein
LFQLGEAGMRMVPKRATGLQGVLHVAGAWMKQRKAILTMFFFLSASGSAAANIIYTVDLPSAGDVTVTGTITTDGTLGTLGTANFLNWDFTVSSRSIGVGKELTPAKLRVFSTTFVTDSEEIGLPLSGVQLADNGVPAVPEPSTWAMLLIGFSAVGLSAARHRMLI